jgi:hypothetical protein
VVAGTAGINGALPDILARLAALTDFTPTPVDFAAQLVVAQSIVASIQAGITAGLPVPSLSAQIAQIEALIAELTVQVTAVNAQLTILTGIAASLSVGGVDAFAFDGARNVFGSELATALGGSTAHADGVVLVTTSPSAWVAMQAILKVTP